VVEGRRSFSRTAIRIPCKNQVVWTWHAWEKIKTIAILRYTRYQFTSFRLYETE